MPVKYILVSRFNPVKPEEPNKIYAQAKASGEVSLHQLAKEISKISTVNPADTIAVLVALVDKMSEKLADGRIVRLGDFGSFQLAVSSSAAESVEKFSARLIKGCRIVFRPGDGFRRMLSTLKYTKS